MSMDDYTFDRQGKSIPFKRWTELFHDEAYKRVRLTALGDIEISTVWTGIDASQLGPTPLIFETMVFDEGDAIDEDIYRYATEEEALAGHLRMVEKYAALLDVDETVRNLIDDET